MSADLSADVSAVLSAIVESALGGALGALGGEAAEAEEVAVPFEMKVRVVRVVVVVVGLGSQLDEPSVPPPLCHSPRCVDAGRFSA